MYRLIPIIRPGIEQRTTSQNEVCIDLTDPDFVVRFSFELENFALKRRHDAAWFWAVAVSMDSEADVSHVKNPVHAEAKIGPWRIAPSFDWGQPARIFQWEPLDSWTPPTNTLSGQELQSRNFFYS